MHRAFAVINALSDKKARRHLNFSPRYGIIWGELFLPCEQIAERTEKIDGEQHEELEKEYRKKQ